MTDVKADVYSIRKSFWTIKDLGLVSVCTVYLLVHVMNMLLDSLCLVVFVSVCLCLFCVCCCRFPKFDPEFSGSDLDKER